MGGKNKKSRQGSLKWKTMSFQIQILLPKFKEGQIEATSYTQIIRTFELFYTFSELFQYIFILASQLWCLKFRKCSFSPILNVCKAFLKSQHVLLKAWKHVIFL